MPEVRANRVRITGIVCWTRRAERFESLETERKGGRSSRAK